MATARLDHTVGTQDPIRRRATRPPRERRVAHRFERGAISRPSSARGPCMACGYPEAGHLAFTDPEREMIVALVNQPQPQPLMRRSILRKLAAGWRSRYARARRSAPRER